MKPNPIRTEKPSRRLASHRFFAAHSMLRFVLPMAILASFASIAMSCSIPVFRYALEHWRPEPFTVHVVSSRPLNESQNALLKELKDLGKTANIHLRVNDGKKSVSDQSNGIVKQYSNRETAWLVVQPTKTIDGALPVVWDGPFTSDSVKRLLSSPVRQRLCQGLVDQDSVGWIFLESGDAAIDDAKFSKLESELQRLERVIKLPAIDAADLKDLSKSPEELKLRFSAHRVSRHDPFEAALVSMLLATESDLREEFDKGSPMAFPVFGRGRVLYALLGEGIATGTIEEASRFLAGEFQCTVKADNPGVDLLLSFDWDQHVHITEPKKEGDIPLTGLGILSNPPNTSDLVDSLDGDSPAVEATRVSPPTAPPTAQNFTWITLGALAAIVGCITVGWMFWFGPKS